MFEKYECVYFIRHGNKDRGSNEKHVKNLKNISIKILRLIIIFE